jgi:signal transduction histidine kinase
MPGEQLVARSHLNMLCVPLIMALHNHNHAAFTMSSVIETAKTVGELAKDLNEADDAIIAGEHVLRYMARIVDLPEAALWLGDSEHKHYRPFAAIHSSSPPSTDSLLPHEHPLPTLFKRMHEPIHTRDSSNAQALSDAGYTLGVPLVSRAELIGFCMFGPITNTGNWDQEIAAVLAALATVACISLESHLGREKLRRSSAFLRRTDRLRSLEIMAGGFAHEIRNPLTSIKTFVQLAPERQHDPLFIREFSRVAIEDVHEIERLLHDILDYAKHMSPHPTEEDLNEVVTSCICFVSARASSRGIQLLTDLDFNLPHLSLDRQQIKQALMSLLLNALDATPDSGGDIYVRTRLTTRSEDSAWIELRVEDHGRGISREHLEHIFDPFYTTKHSNSESEGSGLGLTVAHQIIREHHGELTVDSRVGIGSTFTVHLPTFGKRCPVSAPRE